MIWTHNLIENFLVIASVDLEPFNFFDVHRTGMISGSMGRSPIFYGRIIALQTIIALETIFVLF